VAELRAGAVLVGLVAQGEDGGASDAAQQLGSGLVVVVGAARYIPHRDQALMGLIGG
jgi:hypothetical protein